MEDTADDKHHGHHPGRSEHERLAATKLVDTDDQEDGGRDDLDSSIDTRGEESRVRLGNTNCLEDLWRVISYGVCATELLPKHNNKARQESISVSWLQALSPCYAFREGEFFFDGRANLSHFFDNCRVLDFAAAHVGERGCGLNISALFAEPSWRFLEEEKTNKEEATWNKLDSYWDAPLCC